MTRAVMLSAKLWTSSGFSVVQAYDDGTKRPFGEWKARMVTCAEVAWVEGWQDRNSYGIITGQVSGGLEMFEFEGRAVAEGWLDAFVKLMEDNGLGKVWAELTDGPDSYVEKTPSGGIHVLYRVIGDGSAQWGFGPAAGPARKLASRPTTAEERQDDFIAGRTIAKQLIMIESKGEGGFTVMAPSNSAHPTDKTLKQSRWTLDEDGRAHWTRIVGVPGQVPVISSDQREAMFDIARMLCRMPVRESKVAEIGGRERLPWEGESSGSPLDDFEARTDWSEILEPHGWVEVKGPAGQRGRYWRRPGKDAAGNGGVQGHGWSASTSRDPDRDRFYVWSTSTEFETETPMTKGYVWAVLEGRGNDLTAAAAELRRLGFGRDAWADALKVEAPGVSVGTMGLVPSIEHKNVDAQNAHRYDDMSDEVWDWCPGSSVARLDTGTGADTSALVDTARTTWMPDPVSGDDGGNVEGPPGVYLSEEFWGARPVFGILRQAARRALASPEGVLVAAIGLTLARVMPNVVLPACVGVEASLNLMVVTCGTSGDGKSVCRKIAKKTLKFAGSEELHEFPPSSGQGLANQYQVWRKPKGAEPFMETLRWNALATVEESDKIAALTAQASNTLSSELRAAAMGEILGSGNVGETKTNLPEGTYRFVLAMCMQPELSAWLLDEKAGGLPQRFLFACVNDARVLKAEDPGKWTVRLPFEATPDPVSGVPRSHVVMGITDAICAEIYAETVARKRASVRGGSTASYDGHGTLMRLKVAGAFALLDGRLSVTDEDWRLAGEVAAASKATIVWMQSIQADGSTRKAEASRKVKAADAREITKATTEVTDAKARRRAADAILRKLGRESGGVSKRSLRQAVGTDIRGVADEVIFDLEKAGRIRFEKVYKDGREVDGSTWFLVP